MFPRLTCPLASTSEVQEAVGVTLAIQLWAPLGKRHLFVKG